MKDGWQWITDCNPTGKGIPNYRKRGHSGVSHITDWWCYVKRIGEKSIAIHWEFTAEEWDAWGQGMPQIIV